MKTLLLLAAVVLPPQEVYRFDTSESPDTTPYTLVIVKNFGTNLLTVETSGGSQASNITVNTHWEPIMTGTNGNWTIKFK